MAGSGWLALRTLPGPGWVRGSGPAVLTRLRDAAVVRPGFLSAAEEETLKREVEPELRRRRYEFDHWDAAIHGFRETEKSRWSEASRAILQRVQAAAFGPGQTLLSSVHVLDLEPRGYIKPHVDSIKQVLGGHGLPCQVAAHSIFSHLHITEEPSGEGNISGRRDWHEKQGSTVKTTLPSKAEFIIEGEIKSFLDKKS
uniref:AlkB-like protein 7 n=1 Tax=Molossus molossus TaxID=27622 RepID=A0A7J8I2Y6_MOLMO|nr:alkB-like protein 7 [Molossus molossus]